MSKNNIAVDPQVMIRNGDGEDITVQDYIKFAAESQIHKLKEEAEKHEKEFRLATAKIRQSIIDEYMKAKEQLESDEEL